jgi:hypothetical protein
MNQPAAFAAIHEKPLPLACFCGIDSLPSVALVPEIIANPHSAYWTPDLLVVSLETSGPSTILFWPLKQHLGGR